MLKNSPKNLKIGFIGQGYIGKNYADDFQNRGFQVIRYSIEPEYQQNKDLIKDCDIVFVAVPTPTTPQGFDDSIVRGVMSLIGKGKIAVVKSTVLPGTVESLQKDYPEIIIFHSPEFLTKKTAAFDAQHPQRNIIGIPIDTSDYRAKAALVMSVLPKAPYEQICHSKQSELIKYASNCFYYSKVVFMNLLYDLNQKIGGDWNAVRDAMAADPMIGKSHIDPVHQSGRGAGGHCFIKDFEAFLQVYESTVQDPLGSEMLESIRKKNIDLLTKSNKDQDTLNEVYG